MTDYASVLGCETTYPVWEERSAHRCRYLSFDLLPYLKAGENVLAVRLGNGWYHQTERIAEGKFIFGLPKLWFELTLTDADGRQEWIESDRQTLWHPGGLLKNNLFLGEVGICGKSWKAGSIRALIYPVGSQDSRSMHRKPF